MPEKISQEERYGLEGLIGPWIHPMERLRSGIITDSYKELEEGLGMFDSTVSIISLGRKSNERR
jgi:hypothetical protein